MNKIVYHGSPFLFKQFSFDKMGTEGGEANGGKLNAGFGLYFSESKKDAKQYGEYVYTCFLQLQNNVSNTKISLSEAVLFMILEHVEEETNSYYQKYNKELFKTEEDKKYLIRYIRSKFKTDTDIITDIVNYCFDGNFLKIMDILSLYGYTHTIDNITPKDKTITHYIVYNLDCIEIQKTEKLK